MTTQPTYAEFVNALAKPGALILASLTPEKVHLWHMASAAQGEAGELSEGILQRDRENIVEELGDIEFYLEGTRAPLKITRAQTTEYQFEKVPNVQPINLPAVAADFFDVIKKHVIYAKELDLDATVAAFAKFEACLENIRQGWSITHEETIEHNRAKLGKRYADLTYTDKAAHERADKKSA